MKRFSALAGMVVMALSSAHVANAQSAQNAAAIAGVAKRAARWRKELLVITRFNWWWWSDCGGPIGGGPIGGGPIVGPRPGGVVFPWQHENDATALPIFLQASSDLNTSANSALEAQNAFLNGQILSVVFKFTIAAVD